MLEAGRQQDTPLGEAGEDERPRVGDAPRRASQDLIGATLQRADQVGEVLGDRVLKERQPVARRLSHGTNRAELAAERLVPARRCLLQQRDLPGITCKGLDELAP